MKEALSSRILTNILGGLILLMVGWAIQEIRTPDPDLAVLKVEVQGIREEVTILSGLIEDMRRGIINYGNER